VYFLYYGNTGGILAINQHCVFGALRKTALLGNHLSTSTQALQNSESFDSLAGDSTAQCCPLTFWWIAA